MAKLNSITDTATTTIWKTHKTTKRIAFIRKETGEAFPTIISSLGECDAPPTETPFFLLHLLDLVRMNIHLGLA
jgi:hypothetical protein